jgi:hypothetical protein
MIAMAHTNTVIKEVRFGRTTSNVRAIPFLWFLDERGPFLKARRAFLRAAMIAFLIHSACSGSGEHPWSTRKLLALILREGERGRWW